MFIILIAFICGFFYSIYAIILELRKRNIKPAIIALIMIASFLFIVVSPFSEVLLTLFSPLLALSGIVLFLDKRLRKNADSPSSEEARTLTKTAAAVKRKRYLVSRDGSIISIMSSRIISSIGKGRVLPQSGRKAKTAEEVRDILRDMEKRENENRLQRKHEEDGAALRFATVIFFILAFLIVTLVLTQLAPR